MIIDANALSNRGNMRAADNRAGSVPFLPTIPYFLLVIAVLVLGLSHRWLFVGEIAADHVSDTVPHVVPVNTTPATEAPRAPQAAAPEPVAEVLSPRMRATLSHVSRHYRVSDKALHPIFLAVQSSARDRQIDPLLVVAVIGIESRFNPFSESTMGALGLMQVMPQFHLDKLPAGAEKSLFLDPVINIQVGVHILQESIRRNGDLTLGLQQFAGAINDEAQAYANKVLSEKERLEKVARRREERGV
jgi:hypothetical protein